MIGRSRQSTMAQHLKNLIALLLLITLVCPFVINAKSLPDTNLISADDQPEVEDFDQIDIAEAHEVTDISPLIGSNATSDMISNGETSRQNATLDETTENLSTDNSEGLNDTGTSNLVETSTRRPDFFLIESSSERSPCVPQLCDADSTLVVTLEPVGNETGFVSRALGLPVHFECALYTQGRRVRLPVEWQLPNGTQIVSSHFELDAVNLEDSGVYMCTLRPTECCSHVSLSASVNLRVYELSETAGVLLMLSVLASIVILVGVFCYSQKKKQYHAWLKHEILAASTSSADIAAHSSLRQDLDTNSKKYLLNN